MLNREDTPLKFRVIEKSNLNILRKWRMLPEVTKYLYTDPILSTTDQEEWYNAIKKTNDIYWILSFSGEDIGYAALRNVSNISADPGVFIAEKIHRGKGIAQYVIAKLQEYAFTVKGLKKLYGPILSENYGALMVYLKNGWKIEGVLRDHIYKDKLYDVYMVALFAKDWREKNGFEIKSFYGEA